VRLPYGTAGYFPSVGMNGLVLFNPSGRMNASWGMWGEYTRSALESCSRIRQDLSGVVRVSKGKTYCKNSHTSHFSDSDSGSG